MRPRVFLLLLAGAGQVLGQTTLWLRSSSPAMVTISGWTCGNGTGSACVSGSNVSPIVIVTHEPHHLPSTCGIGATCVVDTSDGASDGFNGSGGGTGACTGGIAAYPGGAYTVQYRDATHLALYDMSGIGATGNGPPYLGNPVQANGNWCATYAGVQPATQYIGLAQPIALAGQPIGQLDGPTGNFMRTLATNSQNGLTSIIVTGSASGTACGSNCAVTVNLAYNPIILNIPVAGGQYFSINDSGTVLDTCGSSAGNAKFAPYQVASATSSGYTSVTFSCSGLTSGAYTGLNLHCGGNGGGGFGTNDCATVSLLALTNNPVFQQWQANYAAYGLGTPQAKLIQDGGNNQPLAYGLTGTYSLIWTAAASSFVDPSNAGLRDNLVYYATNFPKVFGGNFFCYPRMQGVVPVAVGTQGACNSYFNTGDQATSIAFAWLINAVYGYLTSAQITTLANQIYNNTNDPAHLASTTHGNTGDPSHATALTNCSPCTTGSGSTSTSLVLNSSETAANAYYAHNAAWIPSLSEWCQGTAYNSTTKTLTCSNALGTVPGSGVAYVIYATASVSANSSLGYPGTGTARAGSANTVTLAAGDTTSPGNVIFVHPTNLTTGDYAIVQSYNAGTGVATMTGNWPGAAPSSGTAYSQHPTETVTGYNTSFTTTTAAGDSIQLGLGEDWQYNINQATVLQVAGDTSVIVMVLGVMNGVTAGTAYPVTYLPKWAVGDVGWYRNGGWAAYTGCHSINHVLCSSDAWGANGLNVPNIGSNFTIAELTQSLPMHLAFSFDSRAQMAFENQFASWYDYLFSHYRSYGLAWQHSGPIYGANVLGAMAQTIFAVQNALPSFPAMNLNLWTGDSALYKIYTTYNDRSYDPSSGQMTASALGWGSVSGWEPLEQYQWWVTPQTIDPQFAFFPTSNNAGYLRYWLENASYWNRWGAQNAPFVLLANDPRIASTPYSSLPHQYLFQAHDYAGAKSSSGWDYGSSFVGGMVLSSTGWGQTDAQLAIDSRTDAGDHDAHCEGCLTVYRVGGLLGRDGDGSPWGDNAAADIDDTVLGDMLQFTGANTVISSEYLQGPPTMTNVPPWPMSVSPITVWASANHGSYSPNFGDQSSQYMTMCSDISKVYATPAINYAYRCTGEFKPASGTHMVFDWTSANVASATQIMRHLHYVQNGENLNYPQPEGHTSCPGAGGCGSLNANRIVQSVESGVADGHGSPVPQYGLVTNFLSPGTIDVNWDCPGNVECSTSSTYPGGLGHTDRVAVCGGGSCSAAVSTYETLIVHKVMSSTSDTSLTTVGIAADANWYGAQAYDLSSCYVAMFFRGSGTHTTMTNFTASPAGSCASGVSYLFVGVAPGPYTVNVGGLPAYAGTVADGDNTIEFNSTAGAVVLSTGAGASATSIQGNAAVGGGVVIR